MPGLPRYDAETFRSLRRVENPSMQIFPSVHVPGEPNLQELAVLPGSGTPLSYTPVSRIKPVQGSPLLMKPEPVNWPQVLFEHVNFGMHRLYFLLNRLPGVAMLMVATWIVWGRGATTDNKIKLFEAEKGMGISAVVVASFHLVTIIVGSMNHNNSPKRALYQTIYRSIASFVNAAAVIVVIVFAAVACSKLSSFKDNLATLTECAGLCYSQKERRESLLPPLFWDLES
ncbi:hypothetical protein L596_004658 [Steinernema carpocapsae]|uniref:Uncharacterized protein n=1 Tax=Steinernema carpocapsae TaxID=34508 RepID=A0A4U8UY35_STECR|nr:hypothetical protein L596_004658 [Steinernema carpocapsae]